MSATQTRTEFDEEEALHYRAVLRRFVDIAMDEAVNIQAEQSQPGTRASDRVLRLDRIARTIRRCILLARKLAEPLPIPRATPACQSTIREAEDVTDAPAETPDTETLDAERPDRLDAPDRVDDLARRPIHEIVAEIARDLGIAPAETQSFKWNPGAAEGIPAHKPASDVPSRRNPERPDYSEGSVATLLQTARPPPKPDPRPPKR